MPLLPRLLSTPTSASSQIMKNCKNIDMKRQRRKCCASSFIAVLAITTCIMLRGCGAFHLAISEQNTRSQQITRSSPLCLSTDNNFAAIMAAEKEASSPSDANFESLIWHNSHDNNNMNGNNKNKA